MSESEPLFDRTLVHYRITSAIGAGGLASSLTLVGMTSEVQNVLVTGCASGFGRLTCRRWV